MNPVMIAVALYVVTLLIAVGCQGAVGKDAADFTGAIQDVRKGTVCVEVTSAEERLLCSTGFYIDEQGTVFTAEDIVTNDDGRIYDRIQVIDADGRSVQYKVKNFIDHILGVALVPSNPNTNVRTTPLRLASSHTQGEPVTVLGYSYNLLADNILMATQGTINAVVRWGDGASGIDYLIIDALIDDGVGGGPVINVAGRGRGLRRVRRRAPQHSVRLRGRPHWQRHRLLAHEGSGYR